MLKTYVTFILLTASSILFAQNIEFKSSNFKDKKEEFKKVEISIEKTGCIMTLRNRYEQNVDMQKTTAFDNVTLLPVYAALDNSIQLTAQKII